MILREAQRTTLQRSSNARSTERRALRLQTGGVAENGVADVLIHNLSSTGALVETSAQLETGDSIELDLPYAGRRKAQIVWSDEGLFGCQFEQPLSKAMISAALLRSEARPTEEEQAAATAALHAQWASELEVEVERVHPAKRLLVLSTFTIACWSMIFAAGYAIYPLIFG